MPVVIHDSDSLTILIVMKEGDVTIFGGSVLAEDVDILRIDFKAVTVHEDEADNHGLVIEVDEEKRVVEYETIITAVVKKTIDRIKVVFEITDMDGTFIKGGIPENRLSRDRTVAVP